MKINVVSANLSTNCTNRAVTLACALQPSFDVEVVGAHFGNNLWPPLESVDVPIRSVPGEQLPGFVATFRKLQSLLDGDVIIACKPRLSSFGAALFSRWRSGVPVILDVDDDELAQTLPGRYSRLSSRLQNPIGYDSTRMLDRFRRHADAVFCVSAHLQQRYGGVIVPHGNAADAFDPAAWDRDAIRSELGFDPTSFVFGFIGSPQIQKGVDLLAHVLAAAGNPQVRLLIVGSSPESEFVKDLCQQYGTMIKALPMQPLSRLPEFLSAVDAVALPQRRVAEALGQMPAKLTDAMAMAKPIIASSLADIPKLIEGCGLLVEPDSFDDLLRQVRWIIDHPREANELGRRARERFLKDLTFESTARVMIPEIERVYRAKPRRGAAAFRSIVTAPK